MGLFDHGVGESQLHPWSGLRSDRHRHIVEESDGSEANGAEKNGVTLNCLQGLQGRRITDGEILGSD
jgi:hypothetical protein